MIVYERVECDVCKGQGTIPMLTRDHNGRRRVIRMKCSQCESRGFIGPDTEPTAPPSRAVVTRYAVLATHQPLERALHAPQFETPQAAQAVLEHTARMFPGNDYQIVRVDTEIALVGNEV